MTHRYTCPRCTNKFDFDTEGAVTLAGPIWCKSCWDQCAYPHEEQLRFLGTYVIQEWP